MRTIKLATLPLPYEGVSGRWVASKDFKQQTSFGFYMCCGCNKRWMSAYANVEYGQQCKKCKANCKPFAMWVNSKQKLDGKSITDNKVNHQKNLCEACRLGVCKYTF